jgi:N-acetyltransferase 10
MDRQELSLYLSPFDRKRIDAYANGFCEQHVITDLLPIIARHVFLGKLKVNLTSVQAAILLSRGFQYKEIDEISCEISLHPSQILALLQKSIKRIAEAYALIDKLAAEKELFHDELKNDNRIECLPQDYSLTVNPLSLSKEDSLEMELEQAGDKCT